MAEKSAIPFGAQFSPNQVELPMSQILANLKSPSRHVKSDALELLAIHLSRLIGLNLSSWLLRSADSNGIEVEVIADDNHAPFNRWQIQCRNARRVDMGDIATAVGRSVSFKPGVVLSVTTGHFTPQARYYATKAMQMTNFQILLIDAQDLKTIAGDESAITGVLGREAERAKAAKQSQLTSHYA
jgi:hypothetical protein